jgi:hypothetical protein
VYRLLRIKVGRVPWDFQLTSSIGRPSSASHLDEAQIARAHELKIVTQSGTWAAAGRGESAQGKPGCSDGVQREGATRDGSHLKKGDLLTRTGVSKDGSQRPWNQYCHVADANPKAKSVVSAETTGLSRLRGE